MKRNLEMRLLSWKNNENRKPLLIQGARQVGKTWLMKTFGNEYFKSVAYVNLETNKELKEAFEQNFDIERLLLAIQITSGVKVEKGKTLLIIDEIQESPFAITSLKYFQENAPGYFVMAAGSLLGVVLHQQVSFPVGKVDFLNLYPLDFEEFLVAKGEGALISLIQKNDWELINTFKSKYIGLLKEYYFVGGMPEAVALYVQNEDLSEVRNIQKRILEAYQQDFSKHAPISIVPRIRTLWNAIPSQLAKENRKFIYGQVKQGARAKDFELALAWLYDSGLIHRVNRVSKSGIPLKAYEDFNSFKLFILDVGLLGALTDLDAKTILEGNFLFEEFKGALTEQYVLQQLLAKNMVPYYWSAEKSAGEIDFLVQVNGQIYPIEVKAEENLKAKSLKVFAEKYKIPIAIRTSMSGYRREDWLVNIPLFAIGLVDFENSF
ncbi:ATP-binding protein [Belliella sp. DSM 107340]|uniref:ATP-binding protein n=1 Tax=Belliella calami TaxID=2923436 RepID=A0ABS9UPK6_9BACT|nr:ATP-binding protein [Belliella calami]MCH7398557.1 ATP-binding protein [Belliella calami]